jgi:hypothetical protein
VIRKATGAVVRATGVLSIANAGPGTNGSQFFITVAPTPHLDNRHSVFGKVIEGQDVANAIANAPRGAQDRPNQEIAMKSVKIVRVGDKAKAFKADQEHFNKLQGSADERKAAAAKEAAASKKSSPSSSRRIPARKS